MSGNDEEWTEVTSSRKNRKKENSVEIITEEEKEEKARIKENNKKRKLAIKEWKRIQREERLREEMLRPKDSKITVIRRPDAMTHVEKKKVIPEKPVPVQQPKNPYMTSKHRKKEPTTIDFASIIKVQSQIAKQEKPKIIKRIVEAPRPVGNILDSTAPTRYRGKEREHPKVKKKSRMKKIILAEREAKRNAKKEEQPEVNQASQLDSEESASVENVEKRNDAERECLNNKIHSRKFRPYCDHVLSSELDTYVTTLIQDLIRFQDRKHAKDPVKAKIRRRYVIGLREAAKYLQLSKIKLLIIAPDIDEIVTEGGLNDAILKMKKLAENNSIPVVYALGRKKLGYVTYRKRAVSCVGIMNYDGSNENFIRIMELLPSLQEDYKKKHFSTLDTPSEETVVGDVARKIIGLLKIS